MSFTDTASVITSSTTRSGVIFLAKVVIISSLVAEFSVASSIGGSPGSTSAGGSNLALESIISGGGTNTVSGGGSSIGGVNGAGTSGNYYFGTEVWFRNLDTQLLRLGSRLDQLMLRMDHLDSRVGRVQSQGHLRFDSIETNMQTTRQRLDLWSNQLNLIEEQLSRKWKNMESRFDSLVSIIDTKFNLVQRDNRRHNEFISSSFNSVIISQEKLSERVVNSLSEMNSTVTRTKSIISNTTSSLFTQLTGECSSNTLSNVLSTFFANFTLRSCAQNSIQQQQQNNNNNHHQPHHHHHHHSSSRNNNNLVGYEQLLPSSTSPNSQHFFHSSSSAYSSLPQGLNSTAQVQLITTKVTNMFDELVKRSEKLETIVRDTFTMSNATRRDVQDGFRALIPVVNQISSGDYRGGGRSVSSNGGASSAEVMSMVVDAFASVESISTALGRRMTELSRSIEERFEMVSMTLNGFLESCLRIQEKEGLLIEPIAIILERILDTIDNSTRNATETWEKVQTQLLKEQQNLHQFYHHQRQSHHQHHAQSKRNMSSCSDNLIMASLQRNGNHPQSRYASQGHADNNKGVLSPPLSEITSSRNRSTHPSSHAATSWTMLLRENEKDQTGLEADLDNVVVDAGVVDEHNNEDNDDHVDGNGRHQDGSGEDESEESLKINRSKPLFNTGNKTSYHHQLRHYQQFSQRNGGGIGSGNVNRNVNPSANLPDLFLIPYPSSTKSEGSASGSTNIRTSSQSSMTFSSQHNVNDNVNPALQGFLPSSSSSSSVLLGVRTMSLSDNNNGMGVVSSSGNSAHVNSNSNNRNNHNGEKLHGGVHVEFDDLDEEEKQRFWESMLPSHTPRPASVPE